jgi:hypothetical protein
MSCANAKQNIGDDLLPDDATESASMAILVRRRETESDGLWNAQLAARLDRRPPQGRSLTRDRDWMQNIRLATRIRRV